MIRRQNGKTIHRWEEGLPLASMTRRRLLEQMGIALGGALSGGVVSAVLGGCKPRSPAGSWTPRTLTSDQDALVVEIAERILPATETPGATDARVNEFVDTLLTDWLGDAERDRFLDGLTALDAEAVRRFDRPFVDLSQERQIALLEPLDVEAAELRRAAAGAREEVDEMPFFGLMKEMTLVGYYTSEIGMVEELQHTGFTGTFDGCVPLETA
jgi:hypothetical protein